MWHPVSGIVVGIPQGIPNTIDAVRPCSHLLSSSHTHATPTRMYARFTISLVSLRRLELRVASRRPPRRCYEHQLESLQRMFMLMIGVRHRPGENDHHGVSGCVSSDGGRGRESGVSGGGGRGSLCSLSRSRTHLLPRPSSLLPIDHAACLLSNSHRHHHHHNNHCYSSRTFNMSDELCINAIRAFWFVILCRLCIEYAQNLAPETHPSKLRGC